MFPKSEPLPTHKEQFAKLSKSLQEVIILVQQKYNAYWWNPNCKVKCTSHKKVHKYSFEAYCMGAAIGYFGADTIKEMKNWLEEK